MKQTRNTWWVAAGVAALTIGCNGSDETPEDYASFEQLSLEVCDPATASFSVEITNPYFPMPVGRVLTLEGDDDGTAVRIRMTVLGETEEVAGVTTRVLEEAEWEDGQQVEISRNFYAQASDGTVCYFGEDVDDYEDGEIVAHDGAWRAGGDNRPGIQMPAEPRVGVKFAIEAAPGIAEDMTAITSIGDTVSTPNGEYTDTVRMFDWNPLEDEDGGDEKYFARDVGMIVDEVSKLTELTLGEPVEQ